MLQIEVPRYERVPCDRAVAVGNEAVVHAGPGLIALLEAPLGDGLYILGAGYQAPLTVPFGVAVTAALGSLVATDPQQDRWMVRRASITFANRARDDDSIVAHAVVERLTEHDAFVNASARGSTSGELLRAQVRVIALREGRYAAVAPGELPQRSAASSHDDMPSREAAEVTGNHALDDERPLLRLRPPRRLATKAQTQLTFDPDVVKLLINPVAGHRTPLGRRIHPLGGAPFGAALTTALAVAGENDPDRPARTRIVRADVTWLLPLTLDAPFMARTSSQAPDATKATIDVIGADGRVVLKAGIEWLQQ